MEKTKLGITAALMGSVIYFMGLFGGFLVVTVMTGYVLFFEENEWLRKTAVKALVLMIGFTLLRTVINFIPDMLGLYTTVANAIVGYFSSSFFSGLTSFTGLLISIVLIAEKVVFVVLGIMALKQQTISVPVLDKFIDSHM